MFLILTLPEVLTLTWIFPLNICTYFKTLRHLFASVLTVSNFLEELCHIENIVKYFFFDVFCKQKSLWFVFTFDFELSLKFSLNWNSLFWIFNALTYMPSCSADSNPPKNVNVKENFRTIYFYSSFQLEIFLLHHSLLILQKKLFIICPITKLYW